MRARGLWIVVAASLALAACASPEARRVRGGGPGADVGNRGAEVQIHGPLNPFHDTPLRGPGR
jgi:hypothetical protein